MGRRKGRVDNPGARKQLLSKAARPLVNQTRRIRVDELAARTLRPVIDAIWPPRCVCCGGSAGTENLCAGCRSDLPAVLAGCRQCANPLPEPVERCGECLRRTPAFDHARAAVVYRSPVDRLVQRFKFQRDLAAGRALAACLAERLTGPTPWIDRIPFRERPQLLVPVPLHWRRLARRGFNQAERLALDLADHMDGPPVHALLRRVRATATQSALVAGQRGANVRGAFRCRPLPPGLTHVALLDDVMTTGATLDECARTLKRAGVKRVEVWVVARA